MAIFAYQVTSFAYQGAGQFAYQGSDDEPIIVVDVASAGASDWLGRPPKKKKGKVLRYSDFEGREAYAEALAKAMAEASMPIAKISDPVPDQYSEFFGDEEDDDALIKALFLTMTIH